MLRRISLVSLGAFLAAATLLAQVDARMLRWPDVSATEIVFVYAGDVWRVPKAGGTARRMSTPPGEELFPRFSPDGTAVAFSARYDGNLDLYVMPTEGGVATRVTHHPGDDRLVDWTPDGRSLLYASNMRSGSRRYQQLYRVSRDGGLPERLPMPYAEVGSLSPDGRRIAYLPFARDFRTWKRYRGGMAPEIWLFDLEDLSSRPLTRDEANDTMPMWHGETLYFLSDRDANRRHNLWAMPIDGGPARQLTHFEELDVSFPAIGPADVVFESGGRLYRLELASEEVREVPVEVVTDGATLRPRSVEVAGLIASATLSPAGGRAFFEARGEVFSLSAEHGVARNLTRSSGVAERYPALSPDGRTLAYWSDRSGEYELTLRSADGKGEEEVVTSLGPGYRYALHFSPDGRKVAFADQAMRIWLHDLDAGTSTEIDRDTHLYQDSLAAFRVSWSADGRWLAYARTVESLQHAVFLYDTETASRHRVTSGFYNASLPTFDPGGDYLYLLWGRSFAPVFSDLEFNMVWANTTQIAAVSLRRDVPSPLAPRDDAAEPERGEQSGGSGKDEPGAGGVAEDGPRPVAIDLEGFESRLVVLPIEAGNYWHLQAAPGKLLYQRFPRSGTSAEDSLDGDGGQGAIVYYDLEAREEKTVLEEAAFGYVLAGGGEKLLVQREETWAVIDLAPDQELEKPLAVGELRALVDPRQEWRQIFDDAWRFERDFFYDPGLHGVDWPAMRRRYGALLDDAVTRWDVNYVLGELIGELSASHTYRRGGDLEEAPEVAVGLLGADFELHDGAYRISDVVDLPPWETEARSPLRSPGVDVEEGDYLLAVNGVPVDTSKDPWAAFQHLAGKTVVLTVNGRPSLEGAREVLVETLESEQRLRNLAWIEANRRRVEEASGGRVGYVYVPDTLVHGHSELVRQFRAQFHLDGLVIDERFNGGGFTSERMIELLDRPLSLYRGVRDGADWKYPVLSSQGPMVMLINAWSGSGGDLFPYAFRQAGLGPLVGTRTWGGVIGISGSPQLIDGGSVTVPTFGTYSTDGEWIIEGRGVEPDLEVIADPTAMARGGDPQLEAAVAEILRRLEESPPQRPGKPPYPVIPGT